jgi:hypothetical protein
MNTEREAMTIVRDVLVLRKDTTRRHRIERLVTVAPAAFRVIDRTAEFDYAEIADADR